MPKVGDKHFSYSAKGQAAAKKYARKTGQKMMNKKASKKMKKMMDESRGMY